MINEHNNITREKKIMKKLLAIFLISLTTSTFAGWNDVDVPPIPPSAVNVMCTTELQDYYGNAVRSFTGRGYSYNEACRQSEEFCRYELQRGNTIGVRCVTRGGGGGYPNPRPPQQQTEQCRASRINPSGTLAQTYYATATGPYNSNVKDVACRRAYDDCLRDLLVRQTCRIDG